MGWVIFLLVIALIVQSIRASNLKHSLWFEKEIVKCKLKDIEILTEENDDFRRWLGWRRSKTITNENQKPN